MDTLILNADGTPLSVLPLSVIDWKRSIQLISLDKVTVLKYHNDWVVRSPSREYKVPSIVLSKEYLKWNRKVKFSRQTIYLRDDYTCNFCGVYFGPENSDILTLDHVVPRSKGGATCWTNIVTACYKCNVNKSDKENIKPINQPYKPSYYQLVNKRKKYSLVVKDPEWISYLDWPEKLVKVTGV